jgi:hypothetical protein
MKLVARIESSSTCHFVFFTVHDQTSEDRDILRRFGTPPIEFLPSGGADRNAAIWRGEWGVTFFDTSEQARSHVDRMGREFTEAVHVLHARWEDEKAKEARNLFEFLP